MSTKPNKALSFIFITILIDVIGLGIIIPVLPKLIQQLTGEDLSEAARYGGLLIFAFATMQFLFSPILGGLSDMYGRRPVLLVSLFGLGIDYIFMALAPTIAWLFVGRILAGISGASFTTATAYIADISLPEKRAQNFGLIGAAFGIGFIIGPVVGGIFSQFGTRVPFLIAAAFSLLNFLYGYFILPESLSPSLRRSFNWKRANPVGSLMQLKKYPVVSGLVITLILFYIASHSVQSNWAYYTMLKFNWNESMVGYSLGVVGVLLAFVQGFLIRKIVPKFGQKNSVYIGLALNVIGLLFFAFSSTGVLMLLSLIPYCLGAISGPALQSVISSQIPNNQQGELQGALTSLLSLTSIIGPLLMNNLFAYFTEKTTPIYFPGAPFILGAILLIVGILFSINSLKLFQLLEDEKQEIKR
jgi:DHA1 family tetracycline resistance protein-like MFS transporter